LTKSSTSFSRLRLLGSGSSPCLHHPNTSTSHHEDIQ
jgi:hypothetical protein